MEDSVCLAPAKGEHVGLASRRNPAILRGVFFIKMHVYLHFKRLQSFEAAQSVK